MNWWDSAEGQVEGREKEKEEEGRVTGKNSNQEKQLDQDRRTSERNVFKTYSMVPMICMMPLHYGFIVCDQ